MLDRQDLQEWTDSGVFLQNCAEDVGYYFSVRSDLQFLPDKQ